MEAARDEARARIAARMARDARRGAPVVPEAAQAATGASEMPVVDGHARLVRRRQRAALYGHWAVAACDVAQGAIAPQRTPL